MISGRAGHLAGHSFSFLSSAIGIENFHVYLATRKHFPCCHLERYVASSSESRMGIERARSTTFNRIDLNRCHEFPTL